MRLRWAFVLAGLMPALGAPAQEPEYYPYETESEERREALLTDSALFYRAVQSPDDLYDAVAGYNLAFVRTARRGMAFEPCPTTVEGFAVPVRHAAALRALGASEVRRAGLEQAPGLHGTANGVRDFRFEGEPLPAGRLSAGLTDRNYRGVVRFSWRGAVGRGWHLAATADARTGRDLHVGGVFTHALTAAFRAAKRFGDGHGVSLLLVVPPSMRGLRATSTDEAFTLTGDRLYNPSWGYQDGKVRNARIRREFRPVAVLAGTFRLGETTDLEARAAVEAGRSEFSTLGWYDARTPMPDNYRYLPSYAGDAATEEAWRSRDPRYTQVDWDALHARNRMAGGEALYALEGRVERLCRLHLDALFATRFDERIVLRYGAAAHYRSSRNFKRMRDLLGADFLTDIDQFLIDDDTYGNRLQNDLRHPGRRIVAGDRFGYDYALVTAGADVRVQAEYRADRFRADFGASAGSAAIFRRGHYEKELFPGARSYGRSSVLRFAPYAFTLSAGWAFTPRTYLGASVMIAARTPDADDLFWQPQYNNRATDDPVLRKVRGAEAVFNRTGRTADLRVALFLADTRDGCAAVRYYDDAEGAFCDMSVRGIGLRSYGAEVAAVVRPARRWTLSLAASAGCCEYSADPRLTIVTDADNRPVDTDARSRMGGCRAGNAPQVAGCAEAAYFGPRGWGFRASASYAGLRYVEPALLRRTGRIARQAAASPEAFARFTEQERLRDAFTLDVSAHKTFYVRESRITVWCGVRNLLGSDDTVYAAYESLRVRRTRAGDFYAYAPFETRRTYAYPRSFHLSVSWRF